MILFIKYKLNIFNYFFKNYLIIILLIIGFFLFSLPFLINIYLTEVDLLQRIGKFELTKDKKIIILKHYYNSFINLKFFYFLYLIFQFLF